MIAQPSIVALIVGSIIISLMLLYSSYYGAIIIKQWNIQSGSETQLALEKRTYLISTILCYAFGFQLVSFFLFVYTTDYLNPLFVGAMCAAGTLNVSPWGYPTVLLKLVNFILSGLWLIINFTDNKAYDYPLIKKKYGLLIFVTPLIITETIMQGLYFLELDPDIITSCCGSLFTSDKESIVAGLTGAPRHIMQPIFFITIALTFAFGFWAFVKPKLMILFSILSALTFVVSSSATISFISLYIYELPTHHCPFCILQREYNFIGYGLYISLFVGTIFGIGTGTLMLFRKAQSLKDIVPQIQRRLTAVALASFGIFTVLTAHCVFFSKLTFT